MGAQTTARQGKPAPHISTRPAGMRVTAKFRGEIIADTQDALAMKEGDYPVVYYFPRKDVRMDRLVRSSHKTHCPYKGDASYYSIKDGADNAVWTYEAPFDGMATIKDLLAFYPDKLEVSPSR